MAKMRVTCPACDSDLELDQAFEGQEVECGSCLHLFVARYNGPAGGGRPSPGSLKIPSAGTPARKPRDPDEDDDDHDEKPRAKRRDPDEDGEDRRSKPDPADDEPPPRRPLPRQNEEHRDYRGEDEVEFDDDELDGPPPRGTNVYNGVATASLVLGIISSLLILSTLRFACCCMLLPLPLISPLSLASIVAGVLGLRADSERKPLAAVGLIFGVLGLGFIVLQLSFGLVPEQNPAP